MRKHNPIFLAALLLMQSCNALMMDDDPGQGSLVIGFDQASISLTKSAVPDTNRFQLTVRDSKGNVIYDGQYGASPSELTAAPGTYTVTAVSCEFSEPLFDRPQYGDTEIVVVKSGERSKVTLYCTQLNSGIRVRMNPDFLTAYPSGVVFVRSSAGKLMYGYSERRFAYFKPGPVSVVLSEPGGERTVYTKCLEPQEMLTLGVSAGVPNSGGVSIQLDTSRTWTADAVDLGNSGGAVDMGNAYGVGQAREHPGEDDVWVYGYIVGGDLTSGKCSFNPPFASRTNLVLAAKSSCTDKSVCLSVQLAKGDARDALNLVDHPDLLGRQVYLKGEIVPSYYGIPGMQGITAFELREP